MALLTNAVRQDLVVAMRDESRIHLAGREPSSAEAIALSMGPGISIRHHPHLRERDGGGLAELVVDAELADPIAFELLTGVDMDALRRSNPGDTLRVALHAGIADIARLTALRKVPHPFRDARIWSLELALAARELRWLRGQFASWVEDLQYEAICFTEDWLTAPLPDSASWVNVARACQQLCLSVSADGPWEALAKMVESQLAEFVSDFDDLTAPTTALSAGQMSSAAVIERTYGVIWEWLPAGLLHPDDWFASAIRAEIDGEELRVELPVADDGGLEQDVLYVRCTDHDTGKVRWLGTVHRNDSAYRGVVFAQGLQDTDRIRIELVDSVLRPEQTAEDRLCLDAWQWFEIGVQRFRMNPTNLPRSRHAFEQAAALFLAADSEHAAVAYRFADDPTVIDSGPFLADQAWVGDEGSGS